MTDDATQDTFDPLDTIFGSGVRTTKRDDGHLPAIYRQPEPEPEPQAIRDFLTPDPNHALLPSFDQLEDFDSDSVDGPEGGDGDDGVEGGEPVGRDGEPKQERLAAPRQMLDVANVELDPEVLDLLEASTARMLNVIPLRVEGNRLYVIAPHANDIELLTRLRPLFAGKSIIILEAEKHLISRRIDEVYSARREADKVAAEVDTSDMVGFTPESGQDLGRVGAMESAQEKVVNLIIEQAIRESASDIHIEPTGQGLVIRNRVDGKLRVAGVYPLEMEKGVTTLIKVSANMRADNRRTPDSGVMLFRPKGARQTVDIRVETAPTAWGQTVVMRLQNEIWRELGTLGFSATNEQKFRDAIAQPYGLILVTGPTGSGKTTTLYSSLRERIHPDTKIVTLENPVEFKIEQGVTQMSVSDEQGMTFGRGLRSIVRQDPDIVLVGEIRDQETAEVAIDAAMTGHLVFSTLHANDAVGAVPRMTRLGVEPFLLSSALVAVVAQRLVRRLCTHCRVPVTAEVLGESHEVFEANTDGCVECFSGYFGRVPIHEVFTVNNKMRDLIAQDPELSVLTEAAVAAGLTTMRDDGLEKVIEGLTSVDEVISKTRI